MSLRPRGVLNFSVVLSPEYTSKKGKRMSRFGMHAKIRSQAGQRDALVAVLLDAAAALQQVPGCQLYLVSVSPSEPDTVWVTEVWSSQAAHQASLLGDEIQPILSRGRSLIAAFERIEIEPTGGKGLSSGLPI
jgi:quinol monooxygenase YgiN